MLPNSQPSKRKWFQPPNSLISKISKTSKDSSPSGLRIPAGTSTPGAGSSIHANQTSSGPRGESPAPEQQNQSLVQPQSQTSSGSSGPTTSSPPKSEKSAFETLEAALRGLHISTKLVPPLHSAVDTLTSYLDVFKFEPSTTLEREYRATSKELKNTTKFLEEHGEDLRSARMFNVITSISKTLEKEMDRIRKQQGCSGPGRLADALKNGENLVESRRRVKGLLFRLLFEVSMSQWRIENEHLSNTRLEGLNPVKLASYDSILDMQIGRTTCTENTRKGILSDLYDWSDDSDGKKVYWTNGMAGTGKTTIACTLATTLASQDQLGASFFCTRTEATCRDATRIVPTIAYQLARFSTPFQAALCAALDKDPDIGSRNIEKQFEGLLKAPLLESKNRLPRNLVVVIDALDECDNSSAVELVLGLCLRFASGLPIKFFVSSRPEPKIYETMSQKPEVRDVLILHEIKKSLVQADIEVYLQNKLAFMSPPEDKIKQLAEIAGNLFIYAATAVRYIRPPKSTVNHKKRLEAILKINPRSAATKQLAGIDVLYSAVLEDAIENEELEPEEAEAMKLVLGMVLCAREPVPIETIALLMQLDEEEALAALKPLRSVLFVSESSELVSTLHASFPDFMFNKERSGRFFCDQTHLNTLLARRCFEVMKEQLRFNICNLESSFVPDDQVPDLEERIARSISTGLFYACRYWGDHLEPAEASDKLCEILNEFLSCRLLFWMEVLSLKRCMKMGPAALLKAQQGIQIAGLGLDLRKLLVDSHRFITRFCATPIMHSTPHIYISALPLCARASQVFKTYQPQMKGLIAVGGTLMTQRESAYLDAWQVGDDVRSLAFSPNGIHVASAAGQMITVHNVQNGLAVSGPFRAHNANVYSVAFSPAGEHIVSGSEDQTICVWSVRDATRTAGPFVGHTEAVLSVSFSPDGRHIVSGSRDCTARIWDAHRGTLVTGPLITSCGAVCSVAFSPDSTLIVAGTQGGAVHIWRTESGVFVTGLFQQHSRAAVVSVRFSPDGRRIVSSLRDGVVCVWDAPDGTPVPVASSFKRDRNRLFSSVTVSPDCTLVAFGSNTIQVRSLADDELVAGPFEGNASSLAFSIDCSYLLSGSSDGTVCLWDVRGGKSTLLVPEGHFKYIRTIAFSPDGAQIVTGSEDSTICIWNTLNGIPVAGPFHGHNKEVYSVAFSPDGKYVVSGSADKTIRIWRARDGAHVAGPLVWHKGYVSCVCFSPDGRSIVSGSYDGTVCVWDPHKGTLIASSEGHGGAVHSVMFSPDSELVVSGSDDCTIRIWSMANEELVTRSSAKHTYAILCVGFLPDGRRIVSASGGRTVCVWDVSDGTLISGPFEPQHKVLFGSVVLSPDGVLAAVDRWGHDFEIHSEVNGALNNDPLESSDAISSLAWSSDSAKLASTAIGQGIRIWARQPPPNIHPALTGWKVAYGWLVNARSDLLFAIPEDIIHRFPTPRNPLTICDRGSITVDYSNILIGDRWHECYIGS